jgi:hypothetical protein
MRPPVHRGLCLRPGGKSELTDSGVWNAENLLRNPRGLFFLQSIVNGVWERLAAASKIEK